jgi:hypothetical protein
MVSGRTFVVGIAVLVLAGCSSLSAPPQDSERWKADWRDRASRWADGAGAGASAVGSSVKTAATGVAKGFDEPDPKGYGRYPKGYAEKVRRHLHRFEGIPEKASISLGKPEKGYMNQGILLGGGVAWQGWLIDVNVKIPSRFEGQEREQSLIVRMRDGEVVEVHEARYAAALRRLDAAVPAKAQGS